MPLPPTSPDKPKADEQRIPPGAKFLDAEIAGLVAAARRDAGKPACRGPEAVAGAAKPDGGAGLAEVAADLVSQNRAEIVSKTEGRLLRGAPVVAHYAGRVA
jgi:hypothetical protein